MDEELVIVNDEEPQSRAVKCSECGRPVRGEKYLLSRDGTILCMECWLD